MSKGNLQNNSLQNLLHSPFCFLVFTYLGEGEERGCDDDGDEELEDPALRGPGVVHGAVVVDGVVDGDVALEGDRHRQEDGASQRDPVQRVQELGRRGRNDLINCNWLTN